MGTVRVEGHSSLGRDDESTAIVNTDMNGYRLRERKRELFKKQTYEINTLKEEVGEIKNLLHTILEKLNG